MLVFSTQLCELLPLSPSFWFNPPSPPLLPCVNKYIVYTYTMCKTGGKLWGSGPQTDKHPPQSHLKVKFLDDDILHCLLDSLLKEGGVGGAKKAWSTVNHSILSDLA